MPITHREKSKNILTPYSKQPITLPAIRNSEYILNVLFNDKENKSINQQNGSDIFNTIQLQSFIGKDYQVAESVLSQIYNTLYYKLLQQYYKYFKKELQPITDMVNSLSKFSLKNKKEYIHCHGLFELMEILYRNNQSSSFYISLYKKENSALFLNDYKNIVFKFTKKMLLICDISHHKGAITTDNISPISSNKQHISIPYKNEDNRVNKLIHYTFKSSSSSNKQEVRAIYFKQKSVKSLVKALIIFSYFKMYLSKIYNYSKWKIGDSSSYLHKKYNSSMSIFNKDIIEHPLTFLNAFINVIPIINNEIILFFISTIELSKLKNFDSLDMSSSKLNYPNLLNETHFDNNILKNNKKLEKISNTFDNLIQKLLSTQTIEIINRKVRIEREIILNNKRIREKFENISP